MWFILIVVFLNLALGLALGCYLGQCYRLAHTARGEMPLHEDLSASFEELFPDDLRNFVGGPSPEAAPIEASPAPAPVPSVSAPAAPPESDEKKSPNRIAIETMQRVVGEGRQQLHDGRERYKRAVEGGNVGLIELCLMRVADEMRQYRDDCLEAFTTFETCHPDTEDFVILRKRIHDAIDAQARAVREASMTFEMFDSDRQELSIQESHSALERVLFRADLLRDLLEEAIVALAEAEGSFDRLAPAHAADPTTSIPNRLGLAIHLRKWWQKDIHHARRLSFGSVDLDELGKINRRFGDAVGDRLLCQVARLIQQELGDHGYVARIGGTRFALCAMDEDADRIASAVEQIRQTLDGADVRLGEEKIGVTASCAITNAVASDTLDTLLDRLDAGIAEAKRTGRNRTFQCDGAKPAPIVPPNVAPRPCTIELAT